MTRIDLNKGRGIKIGRKGGKEKRKRKEENYMPKERKKKQWK